MPGDLITEIGGARRAGGSDPAGKDRYPTGSSTRGYRSIRDGYSMREGVEEVGVTNQGSGAMWLNREARDRGLHAI